MQAAMNADSPAAPAFTAPSLLKAAVLPFVEIGIVGMDLRRMRRDLNEATRPLTALPRVFERGLNSIVMSASAESEQPLVEQNLFAASSVGNYGWDPLNLGTATSLVPFREAEIKHGRLAMLAAVAWPLQEILHPILVDALYSGAKVDAPDMLMESAGASPSLLNGGLDQPEIVVALAFALLMGSLIEQRDLSRRSPLGMWYYSNERYPGNLGFDPLNLYKPLPEQQRLALHETELLNGRVAMLAIVSYVAVEKFSGMPIVRATPDLFRPLILAPWFRSFMDASFSMASMDGSIDGVAY